MASYFERAQLFYAQQQYELAIQELQRILTIDSGNTACYNLLALCLAQQKQYAAALAAIEQAIGLSPNYAESHYIKAGILREQGQLIAAKAAIVAALRLTPEAPDCYSRLAAIQYDQNQLDAALASAKQGLQLNPKHTGCMNLRMQTLMRLRRLAKAAADVQTVLSAAPDSHFAHAVYGWICLHRSHISTALDSFREALRLKPDFEWARQGLVEALKARSGFYRFILNLEQQCSQMTVGPRRWVLLIPQMRAIYLLLVFTLVSSQPIFTFLLSLDAYGKLTLTPTETRKNRWLIAGISTVILGILFCRLIQ